MFQLKEQEKTLGEKRKKTAKKKKEIIYQINRSKH